MIRRGAQQRSRPPQGDASIIIFPGVRYETRAHPGGDAPPSSDGASKKRKGKAR